MRTPVLILPVKGQIFADGGGGGGGGGGLKMAKFCGRLLWMAPYKIFSAVSASAYKIISDKRS